MKPRSAPSSAMEFYEAWDQAEKEQQQPLLEDGYQVEEEEIPDEMLAQTLQQQMSVQPPWKKVKREEEPAAPATLANDDATESPSTPPPKTEAPTPATLRSRPKVLPKPLVKQEFEETDLDFLLQQALKQRKAEASQQQSQQAALNLEPHQGFWQRQLGQAQLQPTQRLEPPQATQDLQPPQAWQSQQFQQQQAQGSRPQQTEAEPSAGSNPQWDRVMRDYTEALDDWKRLHLQQQQQRATGTPRGHQTQAQCVNPYVTGVQPMATQWNAAQDQHMQACLQQQQQQQQMQANMVQQQCVNPYVPQEYLQRSMQQQMQANLPQQQLQANVAQTHQQGSMAHPELQANLAQMHLQGSMTHPQVQANLQQMHLQATVSQQQVMDSQMQQQARLAQEAEMMPATSQTAPLSMTAEQRAWVVMNPNGNRVPPWWPHEEAAWFQLSKRQRWLFIHGADKKPSGTWR